MTMADPLDSPEFEPAINISPDQVVVFSLVRTLASSFVSASKVYRKLKSSEHIERRIENRPRRDVDEESESDRRQQDSRRSRRDSHSDEDGGRYQLARWKSRSRSRRRRDESVDGDERSIDTSPILIRAEYDRGYTFVGEKFAIGDLTTRNQLQHEIITLQQALLQIYEDTDKHHHPPSHHLQNLVQTTRHARLSAIDALAAQYKRMQPPPSETRKPHHDHHLPGAFPPSHPPSTPSLSSSTTSSKSLYCIYARDLQQNHFLPLSDNFKPDGDHRCPYCRAHIAARLSKAWEITKGAGAGRDRIKTFYVGTRFLVKAHRQGGGFACVLCSEYRDGDTVCGEVRALVEHMWREHSCAELEWDDDVGEEA